MTQTNAIPQTATVVVGLGTTGLSCVRFLAPRMPLSVVDTRPAPPGYEQLRAQFPQVEFFCAQASDELFSNAKQLIVSPGLSVQTPVYHAARARGVEVIGDIELFARHVRAPVVAITGSNGKSTVTTLVGEMFARAGIAAGVGGNLGTPALDLLKPENQAYVLELSSFQLETTSSLQLKAATILNLSDDHMDRYASFDDYVQAKARIFDHCTTQIVNRDDARTLRCTRSGARVLTFGLDQASDGHFGTLTQHGELWLAQGNRPLIARREVLLPGKHNVANALAALAIGDAAGLPMPAMLSVLREFKGLAHRTSLVAADRGVRWVDDSKGTNVGATAAAIAGMEGKVILIAGGDGKGADFAPLAEAARGHVKHAVLIGADAQRIAAVLDGVVPYSYAADMNAAVLAANELAQSGDNVLLSPACASFDMFRDYRHRGEVFSAAVMQLVEQRGGGR